MVIHPHYMKQYNSRWFLFGLEDHGEYGMSPVNKALHLVAHALVIGALGLHGLQERLHAVAQRLGILQTVVAVLQLR